MQGERTRPGPLYCRAVGLTFDFTAELWEWTGDAAWFFLTLPVDDAEEIRELVPSRRGFGSVRVEVEIGTSTWRTSVFPDTASGSYLLPVKKKVRLEQRIDAGDSVDVSLRILLDEL